MKITKSKLIEIIREEIKNLDEAISLKDAGGAIFDTVIGFKKIYEKSPHKKNRKINKYIQQILKIEQQLSNELVDLDEGKLNEAKRHELEIHVQDKLKVDKILKQMRLKPGKDYDVKALDSKGKEQKFFILPKHRNEFLELLIKNKIKVRG